MVARSAVPMPMPDGDLETERAKPFDATPAFALTQHDALLDFWHVYEANYDQVQQAAMALALDHPEFGPLVRAMSPDQIAEQNRRSRALLRSAIVDGAWDGYLADARAQGSLYARLGVSFSGWYEVIRIFQQVLVPSLVETYRGDAARLAGTITAMMSFLDYAMTLIAEQYLNTKEEDRFRVLVEAISDYSIIMLAPDGTVASWNPGARTVKGFEDAEILGKHFSVFYPPDDQERGTPEKALQAAANDGRWEDEGWRVRKDGARFWANSIITAVRNAQGKVAGFAEVTRDLTEHMRVERELQTLVQRLEERTLQLESANAELDGFTYSVSHDLRAPLRAIDGFARVLMEDHGLRLDDDGKRIAQIICNNTQKMGRLIDDLLNFAQLGRHEVALAPIDMAALARRVAEEVREPERTIDVEVADLPHALGNAALVRQVWVNLLSNAVKYTRPRSRAVIEVRGETRGKEIVYAVKDNGVGFDPQYMNKLFGVFQRLHKASEFEGVGVGLALVQRIVRRHGGWVKAEGTLGKGATFTFALPWKELRDGS